MGGIDIEGGGNMKALKLTISNRGVDAVYWLPIKRKTGL